MVELQKCGFLQLIAVALALPLPSLHAHAAGSLQPLANVSAVATGGDHACALLNDRTVQCWGANAQGQLGRGVRDEGGSTSVPVNGLTGAVAIAAGNVHTCALLQGETVRCWGANYEGQLGPGISADTVSTPSLVTGLTGVVAIAAGGNRTCVVLGVGTVECWGNSRADFGRTPVHGLTGVAMIAMGGSHNCALSSSGGVFCWGDNRSGQLGDGSTDFTPSAGPSVNPVVSGAVYISAGGNHTCAAMRDTGTVKCWGLNAAGQIGDGTLVNRLLPTAVPGLNGVTIIAAGENYNCASNNAGAVQCWGLNDYGQLGIGSVANSSTPTSVSALVGVTALVAGRKHSCARLISGGMQCWGSNFSGQLGNGSSIRNPIAVAVAGVSNTTAIAAGGGHSCAVIGGGTIGCWGSNNTGQLGDGSLTTSALAVTVSGVSGASAVVAAGGHTCALLNAGSVKCWGANSRGQLGNGSYSLYNTSATAVPISDATAVAAGARHSCALMRDGTVKCWGYNENGQLGNGTTSDGLVPTVVSGVARAFAIATGGNHSCAAVAGGTVLCWGYNNYGQLGNGTSADSFLAKAVTGLSGVVAITAGEYHTCALLAVGTARCWGNNDPGQLGNGNNANSTIPTIVGGLADASAIQAGVAHTCALIKDGTVRCWGYNYSGQLGSDIGVSSSNVPLKVDAISGAMTLAAGGYHNCSAAKGGTVKCWGDNSTGQLGNGEMIYFTRPQSVVSITTSSAEKLTMSEFFNASLDYYFITSRDNEKMILDNVGGWTRTGKTFNVYSQQVAESQAIRRFYFDQVAANKTRGSHFYTLSNVDVELLHSLNPNNSQSAGKPFDEGVDSYATLPTADSCATGFEPVYRLFRGNTKFPDNPNHRFTVDQVVYADFVSRGWDGEGISFCAPK